MAGSDGVEIREVWSENLEQEFITIRNFIDDFPCVALDTEFPGTVVKAIGNFKNLDEYNYQTLKNNVDLLKVIQVGFTFSDERGNLPKCGTGGRGCVWQFNFREFNAIEDISASDSIKLLRESGIDFQKNNENGIDSFRFAELLMSSGLVLNDSVYWVTFHGSTDFGYLLKLLTCRSLPDTQEGFFELLYIYFPTIYDIKYIIRFCNNLHGGLNKVAKTLNIERVGASHQAGSDTLLTSRVFRELKETIFSGSLEKFVGFLHGLGVGN